jgi:hypothetical protein
MKGANPLTVMGFRAFLDMMDEGSKQAPILWNSFSAENSDSSPSPKIRNEISLKDCGLILLDDF